ncbi:ABC transporter permease [Fodinicola feengrottensis]|uniref:ABC transporter permease n=1 Tax=Fodinicola feengrottensis TaxID=435914 RepID=UPI0024411D31|nr:ABC transporter permease [Fodinicola feengrottensis]
MISYGAQPDSSIANIINNAVTYFLSALAVAIGFRMKLFNIGVDGQYRLAAMVAAVVAGFVPLPPVLSQLVTILVAVLVGGLWSGIAGLLKVTRGVSVISTIMLNFIATGLVAYMLQRGRFAVQAAGSNNIGTPTIPPSGRVAGLPLIPGTNTTIFGLIILAVLAGVGYQILVNRSRFGFDLRATGLSASAAVASGVSVKRMTLTTMIISGALAGMVGLPQLLGASYTYSLDFPAGLGFTGIAIALLGRNNPIGIAFGALLLGPPRPVVADPGPERHPEGDRDHHPGHRRAVRGHRV